MVFILSGKNLRGASVILHFNRNLGVPHTISPWFLTSRKPFSSSSARVVESGRLASSLSLNKYDYFDKKLE